MINAIIYTGLFLVAFFGMEFIAWITHKYLMHGALWFLHEDHHLHPKDQGFFQKNDYFFLIFATPGILLIFSGITFEMKTLLFLGLGITFYGFTYFLVHDVFIHQRFRILKKSDKSYFRAIRKAHKVHHKHLGKEDGECFGMLWVPKKYYREANNNIR